MEYGKIFLRPLVGLLEGQSTDVIERLTVEAITKHRALVCEAEIAYNRLKNGPDEPESTEARQTYLASMIDMHAQQTVVSTMLDILGYIPSTLAEKAQ